MCVLWGHMHAAVFLCVGLACHTMFGLERHGLSVCRTALPEGLPRKLCVWLSSLACDRACPACSFNRVDCCSDDRGLGRVGSECFVHAWVHSYSETRHILWRLLFSDPPSWGVWWLVLSGSWFGSSSRKVLGADVFAWCTWGFWPFWSTRLDLFVVSKLSECLADQSRMCQSACSSFFHGSAGVLVSALDDGLGWQPVGIVGQRQGQPTHRGGCWPAACLVLVRHCRPAAASLVLFACSYSHVQCLYVAPLQYPALRWQFSDADCAVGSWAGPGSNAMGQIPVQVCGMRSLHGTCTARESLRTPVCRKHAVDA
jgi:hypothetical protein